MNNKNLFTDDYKLDSYWWDKTPRPTIESTALPAKCDVLIIGSGYTGLNAALVTARAGRSTVVVDAEDAGYGCSTRNGGQISTSIKPDMAALSRKHGADKAFQIIKEGHNALSWIEEFITHEHIDCDFRVCGRFHAAHTAKHFKTLTEEVKQQPKGLEVPYTVIPRSEQRSELATDAYHGGVVYHPHASIDPGAYHQQLLSRATEAGVQIVPHCAVTQLQAGTTGTKARTKAGTKATTQRGTITANEVIVATNGYTGNITPWQQRRVIPIGSYIIATDGLDKSVMDRLMPNDRIYSDTCKVVYYYRASPDRSRILFGGRVSSAETDPTKSAPLLKADLVRLFPELADVKLSHSWMGFVAYTFDTLAHTGAHQGIHYAMGYCGSGVSMASYLGMRVGHKVLGSAKGTTGLDGIGFPTRPLYTGKPWFLPAAVAWYRYKDRLQQ